MIKKLVLTASAIGAMLGISALTGPAHATMAGELVMIGVDVPNVGAFTGGAFATVTTDLNSPTSDAFVVTDGNLTFQIDPFDTGAAITLLDNQSDANNSYAFGTTDADATTIELYNPWNTNVVNGASIQQNFTSTTGLVSDVTFTDDTVSVKLSGSGAAEWKAGESVTVFLTFAP